MAGLVGTHSYQLDPKGRLSLPKGFREAFADGANLTLGFDGCIWVFPMHSSTTATPRNSLPTAGSTP